MRNSNASNNHDPAPMCVDPPDRTWEPNHHTRPSPEKTVIPTKTNLAPQRPQAPMCNTDDNHAHQAHHTPHNQLTTHQALSQMS